MFFLASLSDVALPKKTNIPVSERAMNVSLKVLLPLCYLTSLRLVCRIERPTSTPNNRHKTSYRTHSQPQWPQLTCQWQGRKACAESARPARENPMVSATLWSPANELYTKVSAQGQFLVRSDIQGCFHSINIVLQVTKICEEATAADTRLKVIGARMSVLSLAARSSSCTRLIIVLAASLEKSPLTGFGRLGF